MALGINDNRKVVTSAGTAEAIESGARQVEMVILTAETDNTGYIVVGASTVVASLSTRRGVPLWKGDSVTLYTVDLSEVFIDSTVSGDGVSYLFVG